MLTTGHQLRAARSLIGMDQNDLADKAELNVNTIRSMEASGSGPIAGRAANVHAVQRCLETAGVEFIPENGGGPGVRLKKGTSHGPQSKARRNSNDLEKTERDVDPLGSDEPEGG